MKNLKFRALGINGWLYFTLEQLIDGSATNFEEYHLKNWSQFTGLLDKNGKEIYENDLVKYRNRIYEVKYYYDSFALFEKDSKCANFNVDWKDTEIVGNKYENN